MSYVKIFAHVTQGAELYACYAAQSSMQKAQNWNLEEEVSIFGEICI